MRDRGLGWVGFCVLWPVVSFSGLLEGQLMRLFFGRCEQLIVP